MRRQLRERRREREARLLDLGALVYELHRQGKRAPDLLQEKAAELSAIDGQVRALEAALEGDGAVVGEVAEEPREDDGGAVTEEADALELGVEAQDDGDPAPEERPA